MNLKKSFSILVTLVTIFCFNPLAEAAKPQPKPDPEPSAPPPAIDSVVPVYNAPVDFCGMPSKDNICKDVIIISGASLRDVVNGETNPTITLAGTFDIQLAPGDDPLSDSLVIAKLPQIESGTHRLDYSVAAGSTSIDFSITNSNTSEISDGSITNSKLAIDAVTSDKIGFRQVKNEDIALLAVTRDRIAPDAINSSRIADLTVGTSDLTNYSVNNFKLANGAVSTDKIGDGAVTSSKLGSKQVTSDKISAEFMFKPTYRYGGAFTVLPGTGKSGIAYCNAGEFPISGAFFNNSPANQFKFVHLITSNKVGPHSTTGLEGWKVTIFNSGTTDYQFTVNVMCVAVNTN